MFRTGRMFTGMPTRSRKMNFPLFWTMQTTIGLAAELDGVIVGLLHAVAMKQPKNPLMLPVRTAYVDAICVDEAYRHRGIAKALMQCKRKRRLVKQAPKQ